MNYEIISAPSFEGELKKLSKKYKSLKKDYQELIETLENNPKAGKQIKSTIYKIRLANSDKNRGKSAGYRVYYYIYTNQNIYLLTIYDKSEKESIDEAILDEIIASEIP